MTLTDRIEAIQKRADGATRAPWEPGIRSPFQIRGPLRVEYVGSVIRVRDADFIRAARTDVPALCAALRIAVEALEASHGARVALSPIGLEFDHEASAANALALIERELA